MLSLVRTDLVGVIAAGLWLAVSSSGCFTAAETPASAIAMQRDIAVPMRDGVVLRGDLYRPPGPGPFPTLVYRTPYDRRAAAQRYRTHLAAVERGYAVLLQDVRGRYGSEGLFDPYRNEGRDGYDTIEWAAAQSWSSGAVGTYGLSYPGAVQWLAAVERPPHLVAMVPAMTFSSPRHFFYFGGVFDRSWVPWIVLNIAPDLRRRAGLAGPRTAAGAERFWGEHGAAIQSRLPLAEMPELAGVAPFYFEWLHHPPDDPWWDPLDIRGRYERVEAAVLNLSGWHDEAYGPEGATTNFLGLLAARRDEREPRTRLVIGPWVHGVSSLAEQRVGELDFGAAAAIDYDDLVLDWMDRWLQDRVEEPPALPVKLFVMGANEWREYESWPPGASEPLALYLAPAGALSDAPPAAAEASSAFPSDPNAPVVDPLGSFGPHDLSSLGVRPDVLVFETAPLPEPVEIVGPIEAEIFLSCDCRDTDLWVTLLDVGPDGRAFNLMSPGSNVLRASYRDLSRGRRLLAPDEIYRLRLSNMATAHRFAAGHAIGVLVSATFAPYLSVNLHTGELETVTARSRPAEVHIHHDAGHPSQLHLSRISPAASEAVRRRN